MVKKRTLIIVLITVIVLLQPLNFDFNHIQNRKNTFTDHNSFFNAGNDLLINNNSFNLNTTIYTIPVNINTTISKPNLVYQQILLFNSSKYVSYINNNLSNIEFVYKNGTPIPAWIQSLGNSKNSNATIILKLFGYFNRTILLIIYPKKEFLFSSNSYIGINPSLLHQSNANLFNNFNLTSIQGYVYEKNYTITYNFSKYFTYIRRLHEFQYTIEYA